MKEKKLTIKDLYQPMWFYIHTINGIPAQYEEDQQIVFANGIRGGGGLRRLCESIEQVKKEQKLSKKWRDEQGFSTNIKDYGYVRILRDLVVFNSPPTKLKN